MTRSRSSAARSVPSDDVQWLTPSELSSWLSVVRLVQRLPWAIESQLQRDSGLGITEYQVMAMLSDTDSATMRMSGLAEVTNSSLSRLSHLINRLEGRGLVRREIDSQDGRFTLAILTEEGRSALGAAAPAHVANVRRLVIDALSPERLRRLGQDAERIVRRIDREPLR
jgi:DNA-binding MarR family transcriptional regulator